MFSTQLLDIINKLSIGSVSESAIAQILAILENDRTDTTPTKTTRPKTKAKTTKKKNDDDTPSKIIDKIKNDTFEKYGLNLFQMSDTYVINSEVQDDKDYLTCIRTNDQNRVIKSPTKLDNGKTNYSVYIQTNYSVYIRCQTRSHFFGNCAKTFWNHKN